MNDTPPIYPLARRGTARLEALVTLVERGDFEPALHEYTEAADAIADLGSALVHHAIAAGVTQKRAAELLGLPASALAGVRKAVRS